MHNKQKRKVNKKQIPQFNSEEEEKKFWAENDSVDYIEWSKAKEEIFPNLKPSTEAISLRLPASMLNNLRVLATRKNVPYQILIKIFLDEKIRQEFGNDTNT